MDSKHIPSEAALDDLLTTPRGALVDFIKTVPSPLVILGGGGKMGPSLAALARRAAEAGDRALEIVSVSRFSDPAARRWLEERGVRTLSLDLMARESYAALPDSANVLYLVGLKFGTSSRPAQTWATNTLAPAYTCERYPQARIVALSSGNVYPLSPVGGRGSLEGDPLEPLGEYANSCVARERIFDYYAEKNATRIALIRLSYAIDLRYGVLCDIARNLLEGAPIPLETGAVNCIWQGDANEMILRALDLAAAPAYPLNLTGPTAYSVRDLAERLAQHMGVQARFSGAETGSALLSDTRRLVERLGAPPTSMEQMIRWTAEWMTSGGRLLNKPTHFEVRDGKY